MKYTAFLMVCFLFSCSSEIEERNKLIKGKWQLFHAMRNGKTSNTLENTYYIFKDSQMECNLFQEEKLNYKIRENEIKQIGKTQLTYQIVKLNQDSLTMTSKIGRHRYLMEFVREDALTPQ